MLGRPLLDPEDPPPSRPLSRALLVVEDDPDHRAIVRDILEEEGYRVDTAVHGQDALDQLTSMAGALPDLILLDMLMPVMDGWAFMAALKARPVLSTIPVLVTSCGGDRYSPRPRSPRGTSPSRSTDRACSRPSAGASGGGASAPRGAGRRASSWCTISPRSA